MLNWILDNKWCHLMDVINSIEERLNNNSWELEILWQEINPNWDLQVKIKIGDLITSVFAKSSKRENESYLYIISDWEIIDIDSNSPITKNVRIVYMQESEWSEFYVNTFTRFNNFLNKNNTKKTIEDILQAS